VTARAVAPLDRLAGWGLPLVVPGGSLLAIKGAQADAELLAAEPALRRLGAESWEVREYGQGVVEPPVRLVCVRRSAADVTAATAARSRPGRGRSPRR
jgi:16S rRNA (guanine527-N7)-methyltransferase